MQVFLKSGGFWRSCWSWRIEYQGNFPLPNKTMSYTIFTASYIRQYYNLQPILQYLQYLMMQFIIFTKSYNTIYNILLQLWRKDWPIKLLKTTLAKNLQKQYLRRKQYFTKYGFTIFTAAVSALRLLVHLLWRIDWPGKVLLE